MVELGEPCIYSGYVNRAVLAACNAYATTLPPVGETITVPFRAIGR